MAVAVTTWNFDDKFKFIMLGSEHDVECDKWNAECTLKLEEVLNELRLCFQWQSSPAAVAVKDSSYAEWLAPGTGVLDSLRISMQNSSVCVCGLTLRIPITHGIVDVHVSKRLDSSEQN